MAGTIVVSHQRAVQIPFGAPDYIAHAVSYALFGALLVRALAGGSMFRMHWRLVGPGVMWAAAFGVTDEVHQWFVPGRTMSASDLAADAVGSLAGALAAAGCGALLRWLWGRRSAGYNRPDVL